MKRIFILIAAVIAVGGIASKYAEAANNNYYVSLSTFEIVGTSTANFTAASILWPNITGDQEWRKLILANTANVAQVITFYENCTDTTTASVYAVITLSTGSAALRTRIINFKSDMFFGGEAETSNLAVKKSSTASDVHMTLFYE